MHSMKIQISPASAQSDQSSQDILYGAKDPKSLQMDSEDAYQPARRAG